MAKKGKTKKKKDQAPDGVVRISENRRARHDYEISQTFEAGMELLGTEVKSLRDGHVSFGDAYVMVRANEAFLYALKIEPFKHGTHENHEPQRPRRLLLNRVEIDRMAKLTQEKGLTVVPLVLYFKNGWAKCTVGVGKGKSEVDKRQTIKKRDADREVARSFRKG